MKTQHYLTFFILMLLFWSGCREISLFTTIHPDGSFTRMIRISGDSSDVFRGDLPEPVDSTWTRIVQPDTAHHGKYILTWTKTFKTDQEFNEKLSSDTSWRKCLDRTIKVDRRFGFFYSYLSYSLHFTGINPFTTLNYHNYLSDEDLLILKRLPASGSPPDSSLVDSVEQKALNFLSVSITHEIEQLLKEGIRKLDQPGVPESLVEAAHDSIERFAEDWNLDHPDTLIDLLANWSGNEMVRELHRLQPPLFAGFLEKINLMDKLIGMESYPETVEMPGLLTRTNSISIRGNQVSWEVEPLSLLFGDTEFYAESRVVNNWAFILTGIILLALIILLIIKTFRR